jgi:hypothetical protein
MAFTPDFLRSRQWIVTRRLVLIAIILFLGIRQYGGQVATMLLRRPNPTQDIVITHTEFRPELPGAKPAWIIGMHNNSSRYTYDQIQLAATYMDEEGKVVESDKLVIRQKLPPGDEKLIGTIDFKSRGVATRGSLTVTGAATVK